MRAVYAVHSVPCTYIVEINVGSTVVGEHEVPNGVGALDGVVVAIEGVQEPWVLGRNKVARLFICPELETVLEPGGWIEWVRERLQYIHSPGAGRYSSVALRPRPRG